jgi:hypothetical protein
LANDRQLDDAHKPGDAEGPTLTLVTTASAGDESACAALRPNQPNTLEATRLLEVAARESNAASTTVARARFLGLTNSERSIFVGRMRVLDGTSQIQNLDADLRMLLHYALPYGHEDVFMERLWAWWYRVVIGLLQRRSGTISALEITEKVSDLRDQFTAENLPTLVDREDFDPDTEASYSRRPFVEQLRWIALTSTLLQKAIVDYYRAYTQSEKWVENHLVRLSELDDFETNLKDEWERAFQYMVLGLSPDASPARVASEGRSLLRQVTEQSQVRVRDRYNESFFIRGKYHELADDGRVGWHREFQERLQTLLLGDAS